MPTATDVADPDNQLEFGIGDRWFPCVDRIDPDHLIGVMRRAQNPPADQFDPTLNEWLQVVFGFLMMAVVEDMRDDVAQAVIDLGPKAAVEQVANVFAAVLAAFVERQMEEIRAQIVANEQAREQANARAQRTSLDQLLRIQAAHGNKATGEIG